MATHTVKDTHRRIPQYYESFTSLLQSEICKFDLANRLC